VPISAWIAQDSNKFAFKAAESILLTFMHLQVLATCQAQDYKHQVSFNGIENLSTACQRP